MPLTIKPKVTEASAKKFWKRITQGCEEQQINLMSDESYWLAVCDANEHLASQGDATARRNMTDYREWVACREFLERTTLRGKWTRGANGEFLIRTSVKAATGDVVSVLSAKGERRNYVLSEKTSEGLWKWRGL